MQALIIRGCITDHGGIIQQADDSYTIDGIPVHLEGMSHYCPKCRVISKAISTKSGFLTVKGKNIIAVNDFTTCGSKFVNSNQQRVVREKGTGVGSSSSDAAISNFINSSTSEIFDEQITTQFHFAEGMPYFIKTEMGKTYRGVVGSDGKLPRVSTELEGSYQLYLGEQAMSMDENNDS